MLPSDSNGVHFYPAVLPLGVCDYGSVHSAVQSLGAFECKVDPAVLSSGA